MEECEEEAEDAAEDEEGEGEEACDGDGLCTPSQYDDEDVVLIILSKGYGGEDEEEFKAGEGEEE